MPVTFGNANYRKKFDAFRIIDQSGHEPLKEAIDTALLMKQMPTALFKALESCTDAETRSSLTLALTRALPDAFHAWIKVAEFVYAKPRHITVDGNLTLHTERLAEELRDARLRVISAGE